jgi:hypothetical protein
VSMKGEDFRELANVRSRPRSLIEIFNEIGRLGRRDRGRTCDVRLVKPALCR